MFNKQLKQNFAELIASSSISGFQGELDQSNLVVIEKLANWFEQLGFECQIIPLTPSDVSAKTPQTAAKKFNLLAKYLPKAWQPHQKKAGLLLAGHTDTVPFDATGWQSDPLTLLEKDDKWYGLGSCDMKGFFAIVLAALEQMPLAKLDKPLYIFASADEETTMAGAKEFAQARLINPEYAIIGEPTNLQPIYMHKGHVAQCIRIVGKSGHASDPDAGINAIEIMQFVLQQLLLLKQKLQTNYQSQHFAIPYPTLNFGHIHGGDMVNRICGCCELHIDLRPIPELSLAELHGLIEQALQPITQQYPNSLTITALSPDLPPFHGDANSPWAQEVSQLSEQSAAVVNYATEAPYLQQLGCQTLVLGPGSIEQAHQANEFLALSQLTPAIRLVQQIVQHSCNYQTP